jgi:poly(3-hydroxybutyrate) depolymerase
VSTPALVHTSYSNCAGGTSVELYKIIGGTTRMAEGVEARPRPRCAEYCASDATKVIWEFFERNPKR